MNYNGKWYAFGAYQEWNTKLKSEVRMSSKNTEDQELKSTDDISEISRSALAMTQLGKYDFICRSCRKKHTMSMYCIAQLASGNEMVHTCECGNETTLNNFEHYD